MEIIDVKSEFKDIIARHMAEQIDRECMQPKPILLRLEEMGQELFKGKSDSFEDLSIHCFTKKAVIEVQISGFRGKCGVTVKQQFSRWVLSQARDEIYAQIKHDFKRMINAFVKDHRRRIAGRRPHNN